MDSSSQIEKRADARKKMDLSFIAWGPEPGIPSPCSQTSLEGLSMDSCDSTSVDSSPDDSRPAMFRREGKKLALLPRLSSSIDEELIPSETSRSAIMMFNNLRETIPSPVSDGSDLDCFLGNMESPTEVFGCEEGNDTIILDSEPEQDFAQVKMDQMELSSSTLPDIFECDLMPPPTANETCRRSSRDLQKDIRRMPIQDISNVILGSTLKSKCVFPPVAPTTNHGEHSRSNYSPLELSSNHQRFDFTSPTVPISFAPPHSKRLRYRRRRESSSASPFNCTVEESPQSWAFSSGLSHWRHRANSAAAMESPSHLNPSTVSPFKSTPVKSNHAKRRSSFKSPFKQAIASSPFVSPALVRRHTVTDVSSPFLDKALLSSDCFGNPGDLIGDMSRPYALPILPGISNDDRKYIHPKTLHDLIDGKYPSVKHFKIIDCRFPYEYEGGHIQGAMNQYNHKEAVKFLLDGSKDLLDEDGTAPVLIFHCEFSLHRGPDMYRFIRSMDRERALERYPQLCYPEMYIMRGGYKEFHAQYKGHCEPQNYIEMNDQRYTKQLDDYCGKCHFKFRKGGGAKLPRRLTLRF